MTLNEKYVEDYNNRFARKRIVSDESLAHLSWPECLNACSYKQINEWTQQWMAKNGGMNGEPTPSIKVKTTFNL